MIRTKFLCNTLAAFGLMSGTAIAQPAQFENLDRIDGLVATTVGANIGEPGGAIAPVDRRLRLAPCPGLPDVTGPAFGAAIVSCAKIGWRIRVPLSIAPEAAKPAQTARAAAPVASAPRHVVVRRGDPVQMVAGGASFSVTRTMIADEDGAPGQMIRVRDDRKSDPVIAQVMENGIVRAPGFNVY